MPNVLLFTFICTLLCFFTNSVYAIDNLVVEPVLPYGIEPYGLKLSALNAGSCIMKFKFRHTFIITDTLTCGFVATPTLSCAFHSTPNEYFTHTATVQLASDVLASNISLNIRFINSTEIQFPLVHLNSNPFSYNCVAPPAAPPTPTLSTVRFLNTSYSLSTSYFQSYLSLDSSFTRPLEPAYFTTSTAGLLVSSEFISPQSYLITFKYDPVFTSVQSNTITLVGGLTGFTISIPNPVTLNGYPQVQQKDLVVKSNSNPPFTGNYIFFTQNDPTLKVAPIFSLNYTPLNGQFPSKMNMYYKNKVIEAPRYITASQFTALGSPLVAPGLTTADLSLMVNLPMGTFSFKTYKSTTLFAQGDMRFSFYLDTLQLPVSYYYPLGLCYVDANMRLYEMSFSYSYIKSMSISITTFSKKDYSFISAVDPAVATLQSIQVLPLNETTSLLRLNISDSLGFYYAQVNTPSRVFYVRGWKNNLNGVYEAYVPFKQATSFNISLYNDGVNRIDYSNAQLYLNFSLPQPLPLISLFKKIKNVYFDKNTVSVSNSQDSCILYVSIDQTNTERENSNSLFVKTSLSPLIESKEIIGTYDPITQLYQFPIIIPQKIMPSYLNYSLFFNEQEIKGDTLVGLFGSNAQLYIDNTQDFDMIFPMVIAASYRLVYTDASPNITFGLTFDEPFKKVIIQIAGDYDVMGRNFTFENSKYIVAYFQIDQSRCRPQYYYINYLYTEDLIGNKGEYIRGSSTNVDQFSYLPSTPSEITCPSTTIDTDAPMITSVAISQISDPFKQLVQVLFTTYDTAPGISETNIPLCSFYSDNDYFSAQAESINTNANGSINYKCVVDIPIGYDPTIILSIYGISDLHYNYIGYSSAGLLNANLPYNFTLTPITNPVITSTSSLEQSSDKLIISGHNFIRPIGTCVVNIVYNSTNSGILTPSIVTGSTIVLLNIPSAVNYTISVRDTTSLVLSNSVFLKGHITIIPSESSETPPTLSPTPTSTPTPEPVKCKSDCGASIGSGKCVNGVCVCNPPYNGLDCSSKTDNSTIIPDPVKPSVNVTIPGTSSGQTPEFTSFIYVYGLREIDDTSVINDFVFNNDKWILVKEGSSSNEQVTTVQYKYLLDNSYNTTIVSTVQVFAQATNITFGNQQLFMNPSTIKFTFNITSYPFAKSTNFLQLVMNAALQSTEKTACSFKEFVDDQSNSQYLKLQIEDRSLFGRFIKFGMIDGREQVVTNTQLDNFYGGKELSTSTSDQSYIGLNIPYYTKYALLDPDFSILIEQSHAKNIVNSICTNSKRSLSNGQIAGIVVGGVIFVCVVVSAVIYGLSETARSNFAVKLRKMAISNNGGGPQ